MVAPIRLENLQALAAPNASPAVVKPATLEDHDDTSRTDDDDDDTSALGFEPRRGSSGRTNPWLSLRRVWSSQSQTLPTVARECNDNQPSRTSSQSKSTLSAASIQGNVEDFPLNNDLLTCNQTSSDCNDDTEDLIRPAISPFSWDDMVPDLVSLLLTGRDLNGTDESDNDDDSDAISLVYGCDIPQGPPLMSQSELAHCMDQLHGLVAVHHMDDQELLHSLAYLRWLLVRTTHDLVNDHVVEQPVSHCDTDSPFRQPGPHRWSGPPCERRLEAVRRLATLLVDPSRVCRVKLASLAVLVPTGIAPCRSQDDESLLRHVWAFCLAPRTDALPWEDPSTSCHGITQSGRQEALTVLLWDVRAVCLYVPTVPVRNGVDRPTHTPTHTLERTTPQRHGPLPLLFDAAQRKQSQTKQWEVVKEYLYETNAVLLSDLDVLFDAYMGTIPKSGIRNAVVLASMGYLRIEQRLTSRHKDGDCPPTTLVDHDKHHEALRHVATYLMDGTVLRSAKMACLQCIGSSSDPVPSVDDATGTCSAMSAANVLFWDKAVSFCTDPSAYTDSFLLRNDTDAFLLLLWELRAIGLHLWQIQEESHGRIMAVVAKLSDSIIAGALTIEAGLIRGTAAVTAGMNAGSRFVVRRTAPGPSWLGENGPRRSKSSVVTLTYSNALKRATEQTRKAVCHTLSTARTASARHLVSAVQHCGHWMRPVPHSRQQVAVQAAGEVTMATLGAVAVIGEAIVSCTGTLVQGAACAAQIVVSHKYGSTAGQVVADVGDAAGNLWRMERNVAATTVLWSNPTKAVTLAARQSGKDLVRSQQTTMTGHVSNSTAMPESSVDK